MSDLSLPPTPERPFRTTDEAAAYLRERGYRVSRGEGGGWIIGLNGGLSANELIRRAEKVLRNMP